LHGFSPQPASPQAAQLKQQRKCRGICKRNRRSASPQLFHLSRKAGLRARGIGFVAFPQAFAHSGIVTNPRSHTVAGAAQAWARSRAVPVSRFTRRQNAPTDTSNECANFTRYRGEPKNIQPQARGNLLPKAGFGSAGKCVTRSVGETPEIPL